VEGKLSGNAAVASNVQKPKFTEGTTALQNSNKCSNFKLKTTRHKPYTTPPYIGKWKRSILNFLKSWVENVKQNVYFFSVAIKIFRFHLGKQSLKFNPWLNHKMTAFQYFYVQNERTFNSVLHQFHSTISVIVCCTVSPSLRLTHNSVAVSRTAPSVQLPHVTFCVCTAKW
jgi:hypothetical protein